MHYARKEKEKEGGGGKEETSITVGIELSSVNLVSRLISASISNPSSTDKFGHASKTALELWRILVVNYGMRIEIDPVIHSAVKKNAFYCPRELDMDAHVYIHQCVCGYVSRRKINLGNTFDY